MDFHLLVINSKLLPDCLNIQKQHGGQLEKYRIEALSVKNLYVRLVPIFYKNYER